MKVEDARIPDAPPEIAFGEPVSVGRSVFTPQKLAIEPGREPGERMLVLTGLLESVTGTTGGQGFANIASDLVGLILMPALVFP